MRRRPDTVIPHWAWRSDKREIALRIGSALLLATLALGTAYYGSWPFALFWSAAAVGTLYEWNSLIVRQGGVLIAGLAVVGGTTGVAAAGNALSALLIALGGSLATGILAAPGKRIWATAGVLYASSLGASPILLRADLNYGFLALIFLFAVVWATDTTAYVAGRTIGGPKLMPSVSPKKTWAGALGGIAGAMIAGLMVAESSGLSISATALLAALLSLLCEAGDLFESWLKRRSDAKDSSGLIPGHGGLMDRLDGFIPAAFAAAVIGIVRGGVETSGRGLLVW